MLITIPFLVLGIYASNQKETKIDWGYSGNIGPSHWGCIKKE
jgi:carbonic anhydrase